MQVPTGPLRWTFATDAGDGFKSSSQRFDNVAGAVAAAAEWLKICADNSFYPAVKVGPAERIPA